MTLQRKNFNDFQPLCKAANDIKCQICKRCKEINERWMAKNLLGNPYNFYAGSKDYTDDLGCVGCYQYDLVAYRKEYAKKIADEAARHTSEFIFNKLYKGDKSTILAQNFRYLIFWTKI